MQGRYVKRKRKKKSEQSFGWIIITCFIILRESPRKNHDLKQPHAHMLASKASGVL